MQGACAGTPAPDAQLTPPLQSDMACRILIKEDFMNLKTAASSGMLWLHDLYLEVCSYGVWWSSWWLEL